MENKHKIVNDFIDTFEEKAKEWTIEFIQYMRNKYPELEEVISFQMPTYKLGSGKCRNYIAFGKGKDHFSLHTTDFEYVRELKTKLSSPGKGKGCVNVKFHKDEEKSILFQGIDEIVKRHQRML